LHGLIIGFGLDSVEFGILSPVLLAFFQRKQRKIDDKKTAGLSPRRFSWNF